jgi:hypothetical protein
MTDPYAALSDARLAALGLERHEDGLRIVWPSDANIHHMTWAATSSPTAGSVPLSSSRRRMAA